MDDFMLGIGLGGLFAAGGWQPGNGRAAIKAQTTARKAEHQVHDLAARLERMALIITE